MQGVKVTLGGSLGAEDGQVLLLGLDLACQADRQSDDPRSLPQRRADVLVQWARDATARLSGPGDSLAQDLHTVRTHLLITCTPDQLLPAGSTSRPPGQPVPGGPPGGGLPGHGQHGQPGHGQPGGGLPGHGLLSEGLLGELPAAARPAGFPTPGALLACEALRRLACDATISLLAADARTGKPLYAGRSERTVTAAQWKALVVRDRHCVVQRCRRRPAQCQAHHVRHWLDGGPTDLDNLVLLCHAHHHDHHDRGRDLEHRDHRRMTSHGWANSP